MFPLPCPDKSIPTFHCLPPSLNILATSGQPNNYKIIFEVWAKSNLPDGNCPTMAVHTELKRNYSAVTQMFLSSSVFPNFISAAYSHLQI